MQKILAQLSKPNCVFTQLKISKPSKEHFRGSPEFPNLNFRQIDQGVPEL